MTPPCDALQFLSDVQDFIRHTRRAEKILRLLSFCLGYGLILFLLDGINPLPTILRGILLVLGFCIVAFQIRHFRKPSAISNLPPDTLARTIESVTQTRITP